jgi:hypothetical protein
MTDKLMKPWPEDIDEWTHYLYDASGNPVARDQVVGPPGTRPVDRRSPVYAKPRARAGHLRGRFAGGRIFYIQDEAETGALRAPPDWWLVARDAFNGTLLWKQPISQWFPHLVGWGSTPRQLQHKLVAVGDRVYVTLGLHAPLTGRRCCDGPDSDLRGHLGTEEVIVHDGVVLSMVRSVTDERKEELEQWDQWAKSGGFLQPALDRRETAEQLVRALRSIESTGPRTIIAHDAVGQHAVANKSGGNRRVSGPVVARRWPSVFCIRENRRRVR